jgi:DNA-binding MarR family transcriptional regulator
MPRPSGKSQPPRPKAASRRPQTVRASRTASTGRAGSKASNEQPVVDLQRYVPAYFSWIANKLSGGASQAYLSAFDVGIETWRLLVLLAIEDSLSAQRISRVIGMDKASVSRVFKTMQSRGLITISLDAKDGRLRLASITKKGRQLHDQLLGIALERERAFLAALTREETETLIDLLRRLHENLPAVEEATARLISEQFPAVRQRRRNPDS